MDTITKCTRWLAITLAVVALALFAVAPAFAQTVTTDKADYSPGETVTISGSGWIPGENIAIVIHEEPQPGDPDVLLSAIADAFGNFVNTQFSVNAGDIGRTFTVTATGQTSLLTAQTTFTDSPCPNSLSGVTSISPALLAFSTATAGLTTTYSVVTSSQSPVSGVPGVIELCSYHNGTASTVTPLFTGAVSLWGATIHAATLTRVEFTRTDGDPNNIPLNGSTVAVGSATYSALPTSETIVAHINWAAQCPVGSNTCFKILSPQQQSTTTVTAIHNDGDHTTDIKGQTINLTPTEANPNPTITVHDQATVTGSSSPPTGTVTFSFWGSNDTCSGTATATSTKNLSTGTPSGNSVTVDNTVFAQTLGNGSFSFQATYNGDGNGTSSTSTCEKLDVLSSLTTPSIMTQIHKDPHVDITGTTQTIYYVNVHDHGTVIGSVLVGTPTGNVIFHKFSTNDCMGTPTDETVALSAVDGSTADAVTASFVPTTAGFLSYTADYDPVGDCCYAGVSTTGCELLTLDKIQPSLETKIHFSDHSVATPPITFGATVHDAAKASAPGGNVAVLPAPSGSVGFTFFTGGNCSTGTSSSAGSAAITGWSSVIGGPNSDAADGSSSEGPLAVGSYAFNASYPGDSVYKTALSGCEPFDVVSSISGFSYAVVAGPNSVQAGSFTCTLETSTDTFPTVPDGVPDLCAAGKPAASVSVSTKLVPVTNDYLVTVTVTNNTGGTVMEKVQGGLAAKAVYANSTGVAYVPVLNSITIAAADISCTGNGSNGNGVAKINLSSATTGSGNTGNVVIWSSTGSLGTSTAPVAGFTMAQGAVCTLQVIVRKAYTSNQLQAVTSSWSEFQDGPGSFSGKSPYTGSLATCVLGNGFTGDGGTPGDCTQGN